MIFLPKNSLKCTNLGIKSVVLYPKMYIWSENQKNCTFYTKNEVFAKKNFTNIWSWKTKKIVLFTLKMKFLPKNLTKMYKFWIKTVVFSKIWKCLILLYLSSFPSKKHILWFFFWYSAQVFQWKSPKINRNYQNYSFFYFCAFFMKIVRFWSVFIAGMNSACKNTLISIFLYNLLIRHNYLQFYHRL